MPILHQFSEAAVRGDAITDQALLIRRWLREMGYTSDIFAQHIDEKIGQGIQPLASYRPRAGEELVIYHHSIGSEVADHVLSLPHRHILVYHNITPPEFFVDSDPALAQKLERGRLQLHALRQRCALGLGDSPYNEQELRDLGYGPTGVLPITFDDRQYGLPDEPEVAARFQGRDPVLLFVGRLTPNKKQEDLINLLYHYRQIRPGARLVLVGAGWLVSYERWLHDLAMDMGLGDAVHFAGHVSQRALVTYYRAADLYVSMSEHEGFGKPLIESMHLGLPVLAYAAASVPGTLGGAGILFTEKHLPAVAELVDLLVHDQSLRRRIVARQRQRVQAFLEPTVRQVWLGHLERLFASAGQPG